MLEIIKKLLSKAIDDIDAGNSNISEEEGQQIIRLLSEIMSPYVSKYQACQHLGVSRATFDNLVRAGKLPKGIKRTGFKELAWKKADLDAYVASLDTEQ